jgi:hypothetical protein
VCLPRRPAVAYLRLVRSMSALGLHCSVAYGDQHDSFGRLLPRLGVISREITLRDSKLQWFVFTLDEPFEWGGQRIDHFVIAARWIGHPIGGSDFTSLFVLLDPQNRVATHDDISTSDLLHICWGQLVYSRNRPNQSLQPTSPELH